MSLVAVFAVVGSAAPRSVPAPSPDIVEAPGAASAAQTARTLGKRVEVLDERTPTKTVFADPGGGMTAELTAVPTRVKRGTTWLPIDTTVGVRADGLVEPKAAVGEVVFSGGGSTDALASLHHDGRTLSMYWLGELPKPTLSGNAATYADVLPGVDLVMLAERSGLQQHLVIKSAEAARNPALAAIRLGIKADGLTVKADDAGVLASTRDAEAHRLEVQASFNPLT